jgi:3-methyladenine DNA glycosylase AlkC
MAAQHAITQRFTCELSIRAFIDAEPERTLARLAEWTRDPSLHVRRLVSEGTRPRLPWAPRLRRFVDDPSPVLPLLEALRDDPSGYVRRSVANNLNDIAKDHPGLWSRSPAAGRTGRRRSGGGWCATACARW